MHKTLILAALASTAIARCVPFDWKKTDDGTGLAVDDKGNPIWINPNGGGEQSVEGNTISRLNAEARDNRVRAEKAENDLKAFEGLDPKKAREAIDIADKIDKKQLIDAGKVDEVRAEITKGYEGKLTEAEKRANEATAALRSERLSGRFASSKFVKDAVAVPVDMVQATFGARFEFDENNNIVAKRSDGNPVYSKKSMGNIADFDEALEILIDEYPNKNMILKGNNQSGTGNNGGGGNGNGGKRVYTRAQFDALAPGEKANVAKMQTEGKADIVDA